LTASALLYYSIGLWAFSGVRVVVSTFYALQDTKTPVKIAVISISANILLGIILMGPLAHGGLALSTSLASMLNLGLLIRALKIKLGHLGMKNIMESACKTVLCSAIMGVIVWGVALLIIPQENGSFPGLFFGIVVSIIIGIVLYGSFSFLIKNSELERVQAVIMKGICKR